MKTLLFIVPVLAFYTCAQAQYKIAVSSFGNGGIVASTSDFNIYSMIGQALAGQVNTTNLDLQSGFWRPAEVLTPVQTTSDLVPKAFRLYQNYPNPFNPSTIIGYDIAKQSHVTLLVYDILGRVVARLVDEQKTPGQYQVVFNAGNLPSGVYFYRLEAGAYQHTDKLLLLK